MNSTVTIPQGANTRRRERFVQLLSRCMDSRVAAYSLFALVYALPAVILARKKLIWNDEFFTLYLSGIRSWSELLSALRTGADQHPPTFYYLTHLIFTVAGTTHVTLRLTALIGFAVSCVCLYEILAHLMGRRWGVVALLMPLVAPVFSYAIEARGYGLELGFATFSLLMWMLAVEGRKRRLTLPGLAIGLFCAVASHYYAVLVVVALATGELVRTARRARVDFGVWCAFLCAFIPLLLFADIIQDARADSAYFWTPPASWLGALSWYGEMGGRLPLLILAAVGVATILKLPRRKPISVTDNFVPIATSIVSMSLIPAIGVVLARLITHAYTPRYFIAAFPGICIMLLWALERILRNGTFGPPLIAIFCIGLCGLQYRELYAGESGVVEQMRSVVRVLRSQPDQPIVLSELDPFQQVSFYAHRDLVQKLVYLADPHLSVTYLGQDTKDRGVLRLNAWFPLNVVWWHDWWSTRSSSLVYGYLGNWSWTTFALRDIGTATLLDRPDVAHIVLSVTRTKIPPDDRLPSDPSGNPTLYERIPRSGPPLCVVYMPTEKCPSIDEGGFQH